MSWDKLSMSERADIIKLAVQSGIKDLYAIRDTYNEFAKGGKKKSGTNLKQNFLTSLDQSLREDATFNTPQYRQFFTDLARQESGYYPTITNSIGAKGYFQLMPGNRSASWSNPTQQFHETYKLVKSNIDYFNKKLTKKDWDRARELGIDLYGLLGGAHLGGVGGVVRALRGKGNAKDMNGSSVLGYMRQFSQSGKPTTYTQAPQVSQEASIAAPIPSTTNSDESYNFLEVPQLTSLPPTAYTFGSLPTVEDIARQTALEPPTPEELRRQERHEKLERFQNVMGLMSRIQPSVQSSHLGNIASVLGQSNPIQYFSDGGSIHIKPENRGKFTALKERTGHSASWFKENGTPAQKKMATFDLNSRHWKHGLGGNLFDGGGGIIPYTPEIDDQEAPEYRRYLKEMAKAREKAFIKEYGKSPSSEEFYNSFLNNDNGTFNYRRWYNLASPEERKWGLTKGLAHWKDSAGKTSSHPTFSIESPYSGYKNPYNPKGIVGGSWIDTGDPHNERYEFSEDQMFGDWPINRTLEEFEWARKFEDTNPYAMFKGGYVLPEIVVTSSAKSKKSILDNTLKYWKHGLGGNLFDIGGPKSNNPRIITTGGAGYVPSNYGQGSIDYIRRALYDNITPFGYHNPAQRVFNAIANKQDDSRAGENARINSGNAVSSALDAIWGTYLGIPVNQRRKINSKYNISKVPEGYYKFNDPNLVLYFDSELSPQGLYSQKGRKAQQMNGILGNYTVGLGRDNKGDYIYYSDSRLNKDGSPDLKTGWDINPYSNTVDDATEETTESRGQYGQDKKSLSYKVGKSLFGNISDLSMGIGKPVPIYDRIYLDDYYKVPGPYRGGVYLPEVTVYGKRRKKRALGGNLFDGGGKEDEPKYKFDSTMYTHPEDTAGLLAEQVVTPNGNYPVLNPKGGEAWTIEALNDLGVPLYTKTSIPKQKDVALQHLEDKAKADAHVAMVTPTAEDLFAIGTLGGLNNLSPTQWVRRAYDLGEAIKGNMSWDNFGNNWFYGNNGLVSDEYAQEHPYASAAINLGGDAVAFGALSALRKLPKYAATSTPQITTESAANMTPKVNWDADNWFKTISGRSSYSSEEAAELASHVPEYRTIEQRLFNEGKLIYDSNGNIIVDGYDMSPQEYIMRQSEAFQKMNPEHHYVGVSKGLRNSFENEARDPATRNRYEVWTDRKSPKNVEEYAQSMQGGYTNDSQIETIERQMTVREEQYALHKEQLKWKLDHGKISQEIYDRDLAALEDMYNWKQKVAEDELKVLKRQKALDPLNGGKIFDVTYPKEAVETPIIDAENSHWSRVPFDNVVRDAPNVVTHYKQRPFRNELQTDQIVSAARRNGYGVTHIDNVMDTYNGTMLDETIIGRDTPVKSVLGNTGSFDIESPNKWRLYRSLIPPFLGLGATAAEE